MFGQFGNYIIFNLMSLQSSLNLNTKILKHNNLFSTKTYNTIFLIMRERAIFKRVLLLFIIMITLRKY